MFDYLIKVLPNNRLLVRNTASQEVTNLRANQIPSFFENVLKEQLDAQEEQDRKITTIKDQVND